MARRGRDAGADVAYTSDLGRSTVTSLVLDSLVDEGKIEDRSQVRAPGSETVPAPRDDEAIIFCAFLDAGLRIPCVALVSSVLQLYGVELAQLTPNSVVKLGIFEWMLRSAGVAVDGGEGRLFAYLHDGRCQPKKKKSTGETLNFGSVNFQAKSRLQRYLPTPAARNRWDTDWIRKWFYHSSPAGDGLRSRCGLINLVASPEIDLNSREEALLHVLLETTKRLSTRDLAEEFCAFRIWPLAKEWKLEVKTSGPGLPFLSVDGGTGRVVLALLLCACFDLLFFVNTDFSNSRSHRRSLARC